MGLLYWIASDAACIFAIRSLSFGLYSGSCGSNCLSGHRSATPGRSLCPESGVLDTYKALNTAVAALYCNDGDPGILRYAAANNFATDGLLMPSRISMFRMDLAQTFVDSPMPLKSDVSAVRGKRRIFLLSPADSSGVRGRLLLREEARFELATRLRESGAPLGEVFSFISGLYFRGKLAYARAFAEPIVDGGHSSVLIITASRGLLPPETRLRIDELKDMASVPIAASEQRYRVPLERDAAQLASQLGTECEVVLLGSIATRKYVDPLLKIFGDRLMFPADFVGRGDMSRGGLMLRSVREGIQLVYTPASNATRHGVRPPRLAKKTG